MRFAPPIVLAALALLLGPASGAAQEPGGAPSPRRPPIVVIYVDDLGAGELGAYGQEHIKTPHILRFASLQGVRKCSFLLETNFDEITNSRTSHTGRASLDFYRIVHHVIYRILVISTLVSPTKLNHNVGNRAIIVRSQVPVRVSHATRRTEETDVGF